MVEIRDFPIQTTVADNFELRGIVLTERTDKFEQKKTLYCKRTFDFN